jgi:hypothetical protein
LAGFYSFNRQVIVLRDAPDVNSQSRCNGPCMTALRKTRTFAHRFFCIERGHALLHSDRDFAPMERLLGLRTV